MELYNRIGNFWRIKGNTKLAIECFRHALALTPNNADILLNLARVLFNLNYHEDAIFLAERSLTEKLKQPSPSNPWLQYFTLGESFKGRQKYETATMYFQKALQLNPNLHAAEVHLREMGSGSEFIMSVTTLVIILGLIGVALAILYWVACDGDYKIIGNTR